MQLWSCSQLGSQVLFPDCPGLSQVVMGASTPGGTKTFFYARLGTLLSRAKNHVNYMRENGRLLVHDSGAFRNDNYGEAYPADGARMLGLVPERTA
jgi:hypothetical protein